MATKKPISGSPDSCQGLLVELDLGGRVGGLLEVHRNLAWEKPVGSAQRCCGIGHTRKRAASEHFWQLMKVPFLEAT